MIAKTLPGELPPVVISYLRFSKPEQMRGDTVRRQTDKTVAWSERNQIPLDSALSFADRGVSAYRGRNATEGALGLVLDCIESGRIWPGCYLSIESLDRLSRQKPMESVMLMQRILQAGVRIVTHTPIERVYTEESAGNTYELLEIVLTFARAHEESETKSQRLKETWGNKRNVATEKKLTSRAPAWLQPIREGRDVVRFELIESRVAVIRRILQMSLDGLGQSAICRTLNAEKIPTFGRSIHWQESTVSKILKDRSLIGEYQPHWMVEGKREPVGDAIPDYFPAAIDERTFYQVQGAITGRKLPRGKQEAKVTNLFVGLLRDARNGQSCIVVNKGKKSRGPKIVNRLAAVGEAEFLAFPYDRFEATVLSLVTEIDLTAVMPRKAGRLGAQITEAAEDVVAIEQRIAEIKAKTKQKNRSVSALLDLLAESDQELTDAKERLEALRRQQASPAEDGLRNTKGLIEKLSTSKPSEVAAIRAKMRTTIRQFVKQITVLIVNVNARDRVLIGDIELASGKHVKLAVETGDPAPEELYRLDIRDWQNWPDEWKVGSFSVVSADDSRVIELADKGLLIREIERKTGLSQTKISRILRKHGRRRAERKPRDSGQLMTWHEAGNGWVKQCRKKRYFIGCGELKKQYPGLVKSPDREGTAEAANRWWRDQLEQLG